MYYNIYGIFRIKHHYLHIFTHIRSNKNANYPNWMILTPFKNKVCRYANRIIDYSTPLYLIIILNNYFLYYLINYSFCVHASDNHPIARSVSFDMVYQFIICISCIWHTHTNIYIYIEKQTPNHNRVELISFIISGNINTSNIAYLTNPEIRKKIYLFQYNQYNKIIWF